MDANEFNRTQARAERQLKNAVYDTKHALQWLAVEDKPTGTVPWSYDLNEALGLLQNASTAIARALQIAVDPDIEVEKFPKV